MEVQALGYLVYHWRIHQLKFSRSGVSEHLLPLRETHERNRVYLYLNFKPVHTEFSESVVSQECPVTSLPPIRNGEYADITSCSGVTMFWPHSADNDKDPNPVCQVTCSPGFTLTSAAMCAPGGEWTQPICAPTLLGTRMGDNMMLYWSAATSDTSGFKVQILDSFLTLLMCPKIVGFFFFVHSNKFSMLCIIRWWFSLVQAPHAEHFLSIQARTIQLVSMFQV